MNNLFKLLLFFNKYASEEFVLPSIKRKYLSIIKELQLPSLEMTFVPDVVSYFEKKNISSHETKQKLLQLAKEEIIELRPESGLNRLSKEELDKCIKQKFFSGEEYYLSWIRIIK